MSNHKALAGHTSRQSRYLAALDPSVFLIDERSEADLIAFGAELAKHLLLDDPRAVDKPRTLRALFEDDITILLAEIAVSDPAFEYVSHPADAPDSALGQIERALPVLLDWGKRLYLSGAIITADPRASELLHHYQAVVSQELDGLTGAGQAIIQAAADAVRTAAEQDIQALASRISASLPESDAPAIYSGIKRIQQAIVEEARRYLGKALTERKDHPAHIGLFLAYIRLLRTAQGHLNRYTDHHLRFFYREHLGLEPLPPAPDTAHVYFEPLPQQRVQTLKTGTVLGAGITPDGHAIEFATEGDIVLTRARIAQIRALHLERGTDGTVYSIQEAGGLEAVEVSAASQAEGGGWQPFGPWDMASGVESHQAELGLIVSAPILSLAGGHRKITIRLRIGNGPALADLRARADQSLFRHSVSTADGFYAVPGELAVERNAIVFTIELDADAPPVAPTPGSGLEWACWRMTLSTGWKDYAYSRLQALELYDVDIAVSVDGMRAVDIRNPEGPVDTSKPFAPFGGLPVPGASLSISAPEWRGRNLTRLTIEANWSNLPDDLGHYFLGYGEGIETLDYRAEVTGLFQNNWHPVTPDPEPPWQAGKSFPLFRPSYPGPAVSKNTAEAEDAAAEEKLVRPPPQYAFRIDSGQPDGRPSAAPAALAHGASYRLTLKGPPMAFGHAAYPGLIADASLKQALALSKGLVGRSIAMAEKMATKAAQGFAKAIGADLGQPAEIPAPINPPFTPMVNDFRIGYEASASLNLSGGVQQGKVYRLESFGRRREIASNSRMVETLDAGGCLYIGLGGVDTVNRYPITLLFHINDQAGDNSAVGARSQSTAVNWRYLARSGWQNFPSDGVRLDETRGLIRSGIVKLEPQHGMVGDVDSPDLVWVCVSANGPIDQVGSVLSVHTQAVTAVRHSAPQPVNGRWTLPAGSIKQLNARNIEAGAVRQPFATTGGLPPETTEAFRLRVSERLRHKNRAVQPRDYEQLTLAKFPSVGDAKCLTGPGGSVTLVVGPLRRDADRYPKVSAGMLSDIAAYLEPLMPAGAGQLVVRSPHYDQVRMSAWIDADDRELDALLHQLEHAADKAIASWLYDNDAPLHIGPAESRVDVSQIQQALAEVPEVRAVSGVSLVQVSVAETMDGGSGPIHRLYDTASAAVEGRGHGEVTASTEWSVLTPATRHRFRILTTPQIGAAGIRQDFRVVPVEEAQNDESVRRIRELEQAGIGNLRIGSDLVVSRDPGEIAGRNPVYRVRRR